MKTAHGHGLLDAEGHPCPQYQPWYRLHMNAKGYALWASILRPVLEADLGPNQVLWQTGHAIDGCSSFRASPA
jgi:hypothetical protein